MKKKKMIIITILCFSLLVPLVSRAQSIADCLEQLALDYQKLSGLKSILKQMYAGYEIVSKGYNAVRDVSKGNFNLHEAFLDGLLIVSPIVRKYPRVADIINDQSMLMSEFESASKAFHQDKNFNPDEIGYMMDVYNNLVSQSLKNLSDLSMILTDSKMRMSDAERLAAIDRIYLSSHAQLSFLRSYNDQQFRIAMARANEAGDQQTIQKLYGIQ